MTENNQIDKNTSSQTDEIDLIEVFKKIWAGRKIIYKTVAIFFVIGVIIAFGTPKEYKSEVTLLVETGSSSSMNGLLQQFGGLAGLNLAGSKQDQNLTPELYPSIIQSTPFLVEILHQKVTYSKEKKDITVYNYLSNHVKPSVIGVVMGYTVGLPGKIIGLFNKKESIEEGLPKIDSIVIFTMKQESIANALKGRIKVSTDETAGKIQISVEMPEPLAAAQLTNIVYQNLTKYLIDYKIQKAAQDLEFITKQTKEAKVRFVTSQEKLASFRDANKNVISAYYRTEEERLQNEYTLAFNVFNGLSQQMEQSKIKVQEKTPAFKVIEPTRVPLQKSKPNRSLIIIAMLFVGGFIAVGFIFIEPLIHFKKEI